MQTINNMVGALGVSIVKSFAGMPMAKRHKLAKLLAPFFWCTVPKRRRIALRNLELCFPEMSEVERLEIAKRLCLNIARSAIDHGDLWAGSVDQVRSLVKIEGLENITNEAGHPLMVIAPHFLGLDAAVTALSTYVKGAGLYQKQRNAAWNKAALEGRQRFNHSILIEKTGAGMDDAKKIIRLIRQNLPFYYLPDMDYGRRHSEFIEFFGVKAATVTAASKLARLSGAKVVFCVTEMTDSGYTVHVTEPLENFPTKDAIADTIRIQKEIEGWILKFPDQYFWMHRRFKTRPEGETSVYT